MRCPGFGLVFFSILPRLLLCLTSQFLFFSSKSYLSPETQLCPTSSMKPSWFPPLLNSSSPGSMKLPIMVTLNQLLVSHQSVFKLPKARFRLSPLCALLLDQHFPTCVPGTPSNNIYFRTERFQGQSGWGETPTMY